MNESVYERIRGVKNTVELVELHKYATGADASKNKDCMLEA